MDFMAEEIDFSEVDGDLEQFQQDEIVREAITKGVDLRKYANEIDEELREVELDAVGEYVQESTNFVELYKEIKACDSILGRMQEMLLGFQADLGGISDEIRFLQDQSYSMNIRLKNRKHTEDYLRKFLENITIPETLVLAIFNGEINDDFIAALKILHEKLSYVFITKPPQDGSSLSILPSETSAVREVKPELERLRLKAVGKIRDWVMGRMVELMNPKTNVQMLQHSVLIKFGYLMEFLTNHSPMLANEIKNIYIDTMSKTIVNLFRQYNITMMKLHQEAATKSDVIAVEQDRVKKIFSGRVDLSKRTDAFSIATRDQILSRNNIDAPPIMVHVAIAENKKLHYEVIFRSIQIHLMNSATSEYLFSLEFFRVRSRDMFNAIFAKTISLCLENLENHLFNCSDSIGLLLCIQITNAHRALMQQRKVPVLDAYFDRVSMLLWPRFKMIFDANVASVKLAKPRSLGAIELHPHFVTRRYAEFVSSILTLLAYDSRAEAPSPNAGLGDEMLLNNLAQLRQETVKLLIRIAAEHQHPKSQVVFLINNYDQVLSILQEHRITSDETTRFEELLAEQRERYVEEELRASFGKLVDFVVRVEGQLAKQPAGSPAQVDPAECEALVRDFASRWKKGIEQVNSSVLSNFANFKNGMEVLKQVLTQLLLYYTRFQEIIRKAWGQRPPAFTKDIVPTSSILVEIKKYSRSF